MPASCSGSSPRKLKKKHATGFSKSSHRWYSLPDPADHDFENSLGYHFKNRELLREALTHSSFCHEHPEIKTHNERLEFLGDAVLGFIIVEYLFLYEGHLSEAVMAKTKSYIVKEAVLSDIAASLSLGKYLRLGKGEDSSGGRLKKSVLSDAVEAIIGAVYLDAGFQKTKEIVLNLFQEKIDSIIHSGEFQDFKTELQEQTQYFFNIIPEYRVIKQEGKEHRKIFTVEVYVSGKKYGTGTGKNKKEAETKAAREALGRLGKEN
jgi:ribonuclease-3